MDLRFIFIGRPRKDSRRHYKGAFAENFTNVMGTLFEFAVIPAVFPKYAFSRLPGHQDSGRVMATGWLPEPLVVSAERMLLIPVDEHLSQEPLALPTFHHPPAILRPLAFAATLTGHSQPLLRSCDPRVRPQPCRQRQVPRRNETTFLTSRNARLEL